MNNKRPEPEVTDDVDGEVLFKLLIFILALAVFVIILLWLLELGWG